MRTEALVNLLSMLDGLDVDPAAAAEFRKMIYMVGAANGAAKVMRDERIHAASELMQKGLSRSVVKDRLISRFGIGESQAYRDIAAALLTRAQTARFWD